MSLIDPRAIIDPAARLADDVQIGPWSIIGPDVEIGEGTVIASHVIIKGPTRIGRHNRIYQFSSIGEDTPDLKYKGEPTRLVIGDHNVIREGVTIHRGTANQSPLPRPVVVLGLDAPGAGNADHHDLAVTPAYYASLPAVVRDHLHCPVVDELQPIVQKHDIEGLVMGDNGN